MVLLFFGAAALHRCSARRKAADNIIFVRTYKPYMYKTDKKQNIAFVLKTALADRLGRRTFPTIYANLDVAMEKVVAVFNVAKDSNHLEFDETKVRRRYELEPLLPFASKNTT